MPILIVEDVPKAGDYLRKGLMESGYVADLARNGPDGLNLALERDYELIVLDVMLPQMDGWTVLQKLRERKDTPVLFLTARDDVVDRVKGLELGADDYLVKPFAFAELLARIKTLLRRGPVREAEVIHLDDLEIDVLKRRVTRGADRLDRQGVRAAAFAGQAPGRGAVALTNRLAGVGHELRFRHQRGRRRDPPPARQDR